MNLSFSDLNIMSVVIANVTMLPSRNTFGQCANAAFWRPKFWQNQAGRLHHEVAPLCLYYDLANIVKNGCKVLSRL